MGRSDFFDCWSFKVNIFVMEKIILFGISLLVYIGKIETILKTIKNDK
jgi:hypothetical protein